MSEHPSIGTHDRLWKIEIPAIFNGGASAEHKHEGGERSEEEVLWGKGVHGY